MVLACVRTVRIILVRCFGSTEKLIVKRQRTTVTYVPVRIYLCFLRCFVFGQIKISSVSRQPKTAGKRKRRVGYRFLYLPTENPRVDLCLFPGCRRENDPSFLVAWCTLLFYLVILDFDLGF